MCINSIRPLLSALYFLQKYKYGVIFWHKRNQNMYFCVSIFKSDVILIIYLAEEATIFTPVFVKTVIKTNFTLQFNFLSKLAISVIFCKELSFDCLNRYKWKWLLHICAWKCNGHYDLSYFPSCHILING